MHPKVIQNEVYLVKSVHESIMANTENYYMILQFIVKVKCVICVALVA